MLKISLLILLASIIAIRVVRKPEELAIFALILSSTLPVISQGYLLAYGSKGQALRLEYGLVIIGLFIVMANKIPPVPNYRSNLKLPVFLMFLVHLLSLFVSKYWANPFGVGIALRLVETFLFFFIFIRLTRREHIEKLVHAFIAVGAIVSAILLLISVTGNQSLYEIVYTYDVAELPIRGFGYLYSYLGGQVPRIWLGYADEFLPIAGIMAFTLFLLKDKKKMLYGTISLLYFTRLIASLQRSFTSIGVLGAILAFYLLRRNGYLAIRVGSRLMGATFAVLISGLLFVYVPQLRLISSALAERFILTPESVFGERWSQGFILTASALSHEGWLAWMMGFGGLLYSEIGPTGYDINTPILAIYRFGIIGLAVILFLVLRAIKMAWRMLDRQRMTPEEVAVVIGLLLYVLFSLAGSIFRGFSLSENFQSLSGFVILLSWMEVIYRDSLVRKPMLNIQKYCGPKLSDEAALRGA